MNAVTRGSMHWGADRAHQNVMQVHETQGRAGGGGNKWKGSGRGAWAMGRLPEEWGGFRGQHLQHAAMLAALMRRSRRRNSRSSSQGGAQDGAGGFRARPWRPAASARRGTRRQSAAGRPGERWRDKRGGSRSQRATCQSARAHQRAGSTHYTRPRRSPVAHCTAQCAQQRHTTATAH